MADDVAETAPRSPSSRRGRGSTRAAADDAAADEPEVEAELDPIEEFRAALRRAPGDWYVVHSYAGYENRVKANLETRTTSLNMEDFIFQVEVPQEDVVEIKNGQRKKVKPQQVPRLRPGPHGPHRRVLVGRPATPPASPGFVGHTHQPSPLTLDEVVQPPRARAGEAGAASPSPRSRSSTSRSATRSPSSTARSRRCRPRSARSTPTPRSSRCWSSIFGRETPVELSFNQVQKI